MEVLHDDASEFIDVGVVVDLRDYGLISVASIPLVKEHLKEISR